ncbi:MAG: CapA family protein [Lachnospiraceae bacterium]|nr:CapA family protein [Lachnospiraceae bacterium]
MALGVVSKKRRNILMAISTAAILIVAVVLVMWLNGAFLPKWIEWKDVGNTSFLKKGVKAQDMLSLDINHDGKDEVLVLCWRIGRYGDRRPFWVKHDELKWSQHIYIYEKTDTGEYNAIWMASDIHTDVKGWEALDNSFLVTYSPDNEKSIWMWNSWGLEKMSEETLQEYYELKKQREALATELYDGEPDSDEAYDGETSISRDELVDEGKAEKLRNKDEQDKTGESEVNGEQTDLVSIVMVGDILLHDGVTASCKTEEGYDFSPLFENTKSVIENADVAIVNQEVIIGGEELRISGYPAFNAPYEIGDALVDAGFDVVCHGTNHVLDRNRKGIMNCLNYWHENHPEVEILGIHESEEDSKEISINDVNGLKIAILNYTYGTNGIPLPEGMPYAVDIINKEKIKSDLEYAEENADFTIVCPHWGVEYMLKESSNQTSLAKFMTENGADLIIGTHPHVIEPIEWIESENGNKALCYYSIGNFINWTSGRGANVANRMLGGMAFVELDTKLQKNDKTLDALVHDSEMIKEYGVYPVISHVEHTKGRVSAYFLKDYTEELASLNAIVEQDRSFSLDYCKDLANDIFGDNIIQNTY